MQRQGIQKKVKGDPSLGEGGGDDVIRCGGVEGTDNFPGNQEHPLLNELVMDVLFKQYTLLNHDDSVKSTLARLAELRGVCKTWNREIGKILRKAARINIKRLISSYPEGLGWEMTKTEAEDQDDMNVAFKYSAPMPQEIGTFENLDVTIRTCEDLSSSSVIEWFQLMGSSVKSLHLTCTLNCYHQNLFIEKVLKEWCPNLVSLTLQCPEVYQSLLQDSFFAEASLDNQCNSLKKFVLLADQISEGVWCKSCNLRINQLEGMTGGPSFEDNHQRREIYYALFVFMDDLVQYLDKAGNEEDGDGRLEENFLNKLVRRPIGLTSLKEMELRTFGGHVAGYFQENFSCDAGYESDGGILGQLMKMSRVKRLVIKGPENDLRVDMLFTSFFATFIFRRNLWRGSLESFECVGKCPMIMTSARQFEIPLNYFSKVGFPLKKIKIVDDLSKRDILIEPTSLLNILRGYAESLEELEIKLKTEKWSSLLVLPGLPRLKKLVVECEGYRVVKVTIWDILEKFPRLERCEVKLGLEWQRGHNLFFENWLAGRFGWNFGSHPLKELKVLDECVDGSDIERVVDWFPNLRKVELSIVPECRESFKIFWARMKELPLKWMKVSFSVRSRRNMGIELREKAIGDNVGGFKDLEWLELVQEARQPFPLTSGFSKEFVKVEKLRVLKFTNFQTTFYGRFAGNEAQEIKENLANIVVDLGLPGIGASERVKRKVANVN